VAAAAAVQRRVAAEEEALAGPAGGVWAATVAAALPLSPPLRRLQEKRFSHILDKWITIMRMFPVRV